MWTVPKAGLGASKHRIERLADRTELHSVTVREPLYSTWFPLDLSDEAQEHRFELTFLDGRLALSIDERTRGDLVVDDERLFEWTQEARPGRRWQPQVFLLCDAPSEEGPRWIRDVELAVDIHYESSGWPMDPSRARPLAFGDGIIPEGCYVVLGDNSRNSHDSRGWKEPFLPREDLVARIILHW